MNGYLVEGVILWQLHQEEKLIVGVKVDLVLWVYPIRILINIDLKESFLTKTVAHTKRKW